MDFRQFVFYYSLNLFYGI